MVRSLRRACALALVLAACAQPPPQVLPVPPGPASSWILAAGQADTPERLQLAAVDESSSATKFLSDTGRTRLYALGYRVPLAALGLTPGLLGPAAPCERSCELTRPDYQFLLEVDPAQTYGWTGLSDPEPAVLDALVPDRHGRCAEGCLSFSTREADLESLSDPHFLVEETHDPKDPSVSTSALMGLSDGTLFRVGGPGQLERLCQGTGVRPSAAAYDPDRGTLWIAREDGAVGRVDVAALDRAEPCPLSRTATLPAGTYALRLAMVPDRDPPELYVLSWTGVISLLRGSVFEPIGAVALEEGDPTTTSGFTLVVPGAVFFGAGGEEVAVLRNGRLSYHRNLSQGIDRAKADSAIAYKGDVFIAVDTFNLFVSRGAIGNVEPLQEGASRLAEPWQDPNGLAVLQGHLFAVLSGGSLGEWSARTGYCKSKEPPTDDQVRSVLNLQGSLFLPDGDPNNAERRLARWLVPDRKEVCTP